MALFKIKKGVKANLPTSYVEGYCYFTTDDGKFYIDTSNTSDGRICLNAGMADKLTSNAGSATQPIYFSNGKPVAITGNIANGTTGNAATASKLATARKITLAGDVTGSTSFDGSGDVSITTTVGDNSHYHTIDTINKGTTLNKAGGVSAINAAKFNDTRACRTAFIPASAIMVEYTQDNGATWVDYGATDDQKRAIFAMNKSGNLKLGKTGNAAIGYGLRVTITPRDRYAQMDNLYCFYSSGGHTSKLKIEYANNEDKETFKVLKENLSVDGWSGANDITFSASSFGTGGHTYVFYSIRFTFMITAISVNYVNQLPTLYDLRLYGDNCWSAPNNMTMIDHLYAWDASQNAVFPAKVTASNGGFVGDLSGNASTATKLATARTISLTGSITGSGSFDGSGNLSISTITNHTHNYAGSSSAGGVATSSYSLENKGVLDTQEKIDNFLTSNKVEYATFKTSETNNVEMASNDGMILSIPWTSTQYGAQIAFDDATSGLIKVRGKSNSWGSWYTLLHSGNYTSYTVTKTGTGASGTWGINVTGSSGSCTGNAATASSVAWENITGKPSSYTPASHTHSEYAAASHTHDYLPLSGGTMSGVVSSSFKSGTWVNSLNNSVISIKDAEGSYGGWICGPTKNGRITISTYQASDDILYFGYGERGRTANSFARQMTWNGSNGQLSATSVYGAVWNDYAEFRICKEQFIPGQVVFENGDDTLSVSTKRLQRGCSIISDTFGFAIGETDEAKCPIAVSGRVLAYPFEPIEEFRNHIGYPVCSGPNGTVSIMSEEEEEKYPSRIIGTISAIPDYKTWGSGNVEVKNRVWIKVK